MSEGKSIHVLLAEHRQRNADRLTCVGCGCDLGFPSSDPYADPDCQCCERRGMIPEAMEGEPEDAIERELNRHPCPVLTMLEPLAAREPALPPEPPATEFEVPPGHSWRTRTQFDVLPY